jgi:hypothetical protein
MIRLSMTHTLVAAQRSIFRFPFVLLCALVASYTSIELLDDSNAETFFERILMTAVLGIPFLLTLTLALESSGLRIRIQRLIQMSGLLGLFLFYLSLPSELPETHVIRFYFLLTGFHFLVAMAPFWRQTPGQALWQFNKSLLLRLISSLLFTHVLFAGLSLALAALDNLLGVSLPSDIYLKLFMILGFVFNTWYFLGGVPESPLAPDDENDFPHPLRVFAQYILSTLVMVYLAILLAYLAKVMLTGIWPSGWIGWLVSGVAVAGLLSVVLLSPLQGRPDNRWVGIYFRIFHILMLPSLVMLVLAVSKRINQYGLTELRYLLVILSVWVFVILIMGLFSQRINIRMIPLSLGLLALVISIGPWGAVSMSLQSQKNRLEKQLTVAGLFSDGGLVPVHSDSTAFASMEITSSFRYLINQFGVKELDSWLTPEMHEALNAEMGDGKSHHRDGWTIARLLVSELGLLPPPSPMGRLFLEHSLVADGRANAMAVDGFEYSLAMKLSPGSIAAFKWGDAHGELSLTEPGDKLVIKEEGEILLEMPLGQILEDLFHAGDASDERHVADPQEMTFDYANENLKVRVIIYTVVFRPQLDQPRVKNLKGLLLLGDVVP